jgi:hypothetical protein
VSTGHELTTNCNELMMMAYGIEAGQVREWGHRTITVVGPGEHLPRNGKGLVRCTIAWGDNGPPEDTHFWPETLAHYPVAS